MKKDKYTFYCTLPWWRFTEEDGNQLSEFYDKFSENMVLKLDYESGIRGKVDLYGEYETPGERNYVVEELQTTLKRTSRGIEEFLDMSNIELPEFSPRREYVLYSYLDNRLSSNHTVLPGVLDLMGANLGDDIIVSSVNPYTYLFAGFEESKSMTKEYFANLLRGMDLNVRTSSEGIDDITRKMPRQEELMSKKALAQSENFIKEVMADFYK